MGAGLELFSEMGEGSRSLAPIFPTSTFTFILIQDFLQEASHVSPCLYSWPCLPKLIILASGWPQKHQPVTSLIPAVNGFLFYLRTIFKPLEALNPLALATFLTSSLSTMGSLPPLLLHSCCSLAGLSTLLPRVLPTSCSLHRTHFTSRYQQGSLPHWVPFHLTGEGEIFPTS